MRTQHKMTLPFTCLILLAVCFSPLGGVSVAGGSSGTASVTVPTSRSAATGVASEPLATDDHPDLTRAFQEIYEQRLNASSAGTWLAAPALVIPAQPMDTETHVRLVEDLSIMGRIIEKSIADAPGLVVYRLADIYGVSYLQLPFAEADRGTLRVLQSSDGHPKAVYIGGYGVLFSLQVTFPLLPPPERPKQEQAAEPGDPVWTAVRRELTAPPGAVRPRRTGAQSETYKPEAVEGLKNVLTAALKHATNIRDLDSESWLTILVQGPSPAGDQWQEAPGDGGVNLLVGTTAAGRTLLTLRARKADIDQFAKGKIDPTQFRQRVQIATY